MVTGGAIEFSFDVLVDQEAMAAPRPGRRLGNRFQKERERGDEQGNQEQRFSHGIASQMRAMILFEFLEAAS